uniref:Sarcolemmal membrane-associated protein n=1 Tax=Leptobrachium leishanense TaxID=445787 RepID=A0A8C5QU37_9ANUR
MPSALAIFTCRPNSHPFQERHVYLDEPVKIGRSVARCRPAQNNATFDCKVLSRNHALVWFDHKTGKFYLQDTKSSNGTFINSQRLSRGSEESPPCEILSGDIIQFGVDVTENTRKVTHGCIVSTVKLFLPDGLETRRRADVIQATLPSPVDKVAAHTPSMYSQELFQLSQYLQEALHREQMLEQKLATLQRLLANTQEAADTSWQALIDEDRLLSRLEVMGNQLQVYSKNQTDDTLRKELIALQEDKHNYETTAKESLRQALQEKIEVVRKLSEVERSLSNTEDECTHLKEMNERTQEELRELANKYNGAVNEIKDLADKLKAAESKQEEIQQKGQAEKKELQHKITEMEEKEQELQAKIEALQADNDFTNERLSALQVRLELLQEKTLKEHHSLGKLNNLFTWFCLPFLSLGSPPEVKDSDLSDTLSPSKEKSSDDTTGIALASLLLLLKVWLFLDGFMSLSDELLHAQSTPNEIKPDIQQLRKELSDAQELAKSSRQKCLELQAASFGAYDCPYPVTHAVILCVLAQLHRLQEEIEILREEKENEISSTREELMNAQEEIAILKHVSEQVATEREGDIAELQGELQEVRFELEHWRKTASQYEKEIVGLQATFQAQCKEQEEQQREASTKLQAELEDLRQTVRSLENECQSLQVENVTLSEKFHRIEEQLSQKKSLDLTSDLSVLQTTREQLEFEMGSLKDQNQQEAATLKSQLKEAEKRVLNVRQEFEDTQVKLSELKVTFSKTEQENQTVLDELKQCKDNLKLLQEKEKTVMFAALANTSTSFFTPSLPRFVKK